jgi:tetratricopeptide (TPR) repeat protein
MREPQIALAFFFILAVTSPACAAAGERSWDDCLKAPDRACVLSEALDEVSLLDHTDRRAAVIGSAAQTWAKAGEIDKAAQLALQLPDRLLVRIDVMRELAAALARTSRLKEAQATFDTALQLAYGWKDALERGQALYAIAHAQVGAGMKAAADITFDQALQAAEAVRIVGEKGSIVIPSPETRLATLLRQLAIHAAEGGDITQALQIARSIRYDAATRVGTLLALADFQMRAGASPATVLDEALVAAHSPGSNMAEWPTFRDSGIGVKGTSANVRLLCDVGRAQARAGLKGDARASFDEALQTIVGSQSIAPSTRALATSSAYALADIADAQHEAGLKDTAHETLYRAAMAADAITGDRERAAALARVAEVRSKAADAASDSFARALAVAGSLPDDRNRAVALESIAKAQTDAGRRDDATRSFAEAIGLAHQDGRMLGDIASAQWRGGFVREAAATLEEAIAATMADERRTPLDVAGLIRRIAYNDRGSELMAAASPTLRVRLIEAAQTVTEPLDRAGLLAAIARVLQN